MTLLVADFLHFEQADFYLVTLAIDDSGKCIFFFITYRNICTQKAFIENGNE